MEEKGGEYKKEDKEEDKEKKKKRTRNFHFIKFLLLLECWSLKLIKHEWELPVHFLNIMYRSGLGTLAKAYVDAINSGAVPCLENAVITLAERENSAAMQKAADYYSEQMAQRVSFPTDTLQ